MRNQDLMERTRSFSLQIIKLVEKLPRDGVSEVLGRQLLRSGTSVAANYRSAKRAKSPADFIAKMSLVEEEADESILWADLLEASARISKHCARPIIEEAGELTAIAVASVRTARKTASHAGSTPRASTIPRSALRIPRSK